MHHRSDGKAGTVDFCNSTGLHMCGRPRSIQAQLNLMAGASRLLPGFTKAELNGSHDGPSVY